MSMDDKMECLRRQRKRVELGGGAKRKAAQHKRGKLTARERLNLLLDADSFVELYPFMKRRRTDWGTDPIDAPGEGVVVGYGKIEGRLVYVFAQDFTVFGGSLGETHAQKIARVMDLAAQNGAPIIGLNDSGGARIQEGVVSLDGYGQIFYRNAIYSGVIPQISVIMGPCAGGAVYSPALADAVFMVERTSQMFVAGPRVIEAATGEKISAERLGGAQIHSAMSGNAHFTGKNEWEILNKVRKFLRYLPQNHLEKPSVLPYEEKERDFREDLAKLVPVEGGKVYDVRDVICQVLDAEDFMEIQSSFAKNIVIGLGRIRGRSVGMIANQPRALAGALDINASDKLARFIRFCDCFNIPLITFVDASGFLPGARQEREGIIRHGAKIVYAYAEATVPKIAIILRKAYGGAYVAMNSKALGADVVYAWPSAEIAVMGPEAAAAIIFSKEIEESDDPETVRSEKIKQYREQFANPYIAAAHGMVDDIIDPRRTREKLIEALQMLENKKETRPAKKHGNMPM